MTLTKRISELLQALYHGVPERETCIQLGFLATVMDAPLYIFGRSGSGKSLIADRIADAFKNAKILKMGRRQQVFPNKLSAFDLIIFQNFNSQDDVTKENIHTAIHEREGASLILISDQRPEVALSRVEATDHIILSTSLPESLSPAALCSLLQDHSKADEVHIPMGLTISPDELRAWNVEIKKVNLSEDTLAIIGKLAEICDNNDIYVPIRKWIALTNIVRAIAFFNGRTETRLTDTFFLGTPIWGKANANNAIVNGFSDAVKTILFKNIPEVMETPYNADEIYSRVSTLLRSSNNLYETKMFNNEPCLSYRITIAGEPAPLYVPLRYIETDEDFNPFNELRQIETRVRCNYHGTSSCTISIDSSVRGVGLRSSMQRNNSTAPSKFEDFATMPSYILRENDPEIAQQKKAKLEELKKETQVQLEKQAKNLFTLRDLYQSNKSFREDLFCDVKIFDKIQKDVRAIFDANTAIANKLKQTLDLFAQAK